MNWLQCILLLGFGLNWAVPSFSSATTTTTAAVPTAESVLENKPTAKPELIWPDECKKGPEYWCQNARSAKDCGAVSHCIQTVWLHQSFKGLDDSSACKTCVDYVTGFKNITSSNITVKQLEVVLDATCYLIPQPLIAKECMLAVKELVPEFQTLIKKIDPHTFCSAIFICDAASISKEYFLVKNIEVPVPIIESKPIETEEVSTELAPSTVKPGKKLECSGCYTLVTTGQKMFKRASRDDVLNKMLEMCGELSSFSDLCSASVITHFQTIYHHLQTLTVDDACHLSGVCDSLYHFHEPTVDLQVAIDNAPEEANDQVCDFCLAMVDHLRDILISNSTELEFKQVLEGICKQTGNFKDECLQLVDQYYELIYQFLINELDAKELCQEVKLCVPKGDITVDIKKQAPLWPIVPSYVDLDEALKNETKDMSHVSVINKPFALVGAKRCTWGPSYWCVNMTTSKECSGSLNHCIHQVWEKMELPADNGDICNICKDMVKQARDQLNSNETQEELREVFEGSCKLIPIKPITHECIKVVDDFIPELVETLSSQMNPQIVCATVGLCNSARIDMLMKQAKMELATGKVHEAEIEEIPPLPLDRMFPQLITDSAHKEEIEKRSKEACEMCELFLHFVQQQITLPKSEEEIKKVIDNVCVKLPHNVATQCSSFIEVYGDAFIALLAQEIDPSVVCPHIGACSSFLGPIDNVKPTCPLCLLALEALHNKLANNKTEPAIVKALDTLCKDLPRGMVSECEQMVKKSADEIVDAVIADFSPQETCLYLRFCDSSVGKDEEVKKIEHSDPVVFDPSIFIPRIEIDVATNDVHAPKDISDVEIADNRCVLCEFVISKLDQELKDKKTADEIKRAVYGVCNHLPRNIKKECNDLVTQYADMIIELAAYSLEPEQVCSEIGLCKKPKLLQSDSLRQSRQKSQAERQQQLFILYICIGGFVCILLVMLAFIKTKKSFAPRNPPYTRVNE